MAAGGSDFCLTSVNHYLTARAQAGHLAARFASVIVQRSPMAAIVAGGSDLRLPADLPGRRVGGPPGGRLMAEYRAALAHFGLGPPEVVPEEYGEAMIALGSGQVDAVADFVDLVPRVRRRSGIDVRAVPLPVEVYASGLVAADRLPAELVARMRAAVAAALERQHEHPEGGLQELIRRFPDTHPADAVEGWRLAEPNIFTGVEPGSMDAERWAATVGYAAAAHGLAAPAGESVYRAELASVAGGHERP